MSSIIRWEEPRRPGRRGPSNSSEHTDICEALKERPGKWALVKENCFPGALRQRLQKLGCEVTNRSKPEYEGQRCDLYARYVGES